MKQWPKKQSNDKLGCFSPYASLTPFRASVDAIVCIATIAHSQWKSLVTWTDLSNNGHIDELVSESATSSVDTSCKAHGVHAATVQTGHDMLERDLKAMKDNYDKICSEN